MASPTTNLDLNYTGRESIRRRSSFPRRELGRSQKPVLLSNLGRGVSPDRRVR